MASTARQALVRLVLCLETSGALCSCAGDPFGPLAHAALGPKEARATASGGAPGVQKERGDDCTRMTVIVPSDVDTAYARVMSRLRFRTLDERKRFAELHSMGLIDEGFRHTAQPGSYYRMADLVGWHEPGGAREAAWLEVELRREGIAQTRFVGIYCLDEADPQHADRTFRARLDRLLRDAAK